MGASTRLSYNTNVLFLPGGSSDTIGAVVLRGGYLRVRRDYQISISGWAIGNKFRELRNLDGLRGGIDASGTFALSPITRLRFSQSLGSGFNPDRLYGSGALLAQIQLLEAVTTVGLDHELSRSTKLDFGLDATWFRYDSDIPVFSPQLAADAFPEQAAGPDLGAGQPSPFGLQPDQLLYSVNLAAADGFLATRYDLFTYHVGAGLSHEFSDRTSGRVHVGFRGSRYSDRMGEPAADAGVIDAGLSVRRALNTTAGLGGSYVYQRSTYGSQTNTHTLMGNFDKEVTGKWNLNASLGTSWYGGAGQATSYSLVGGLGASWRTKRGAASVRYEHTLYQALGFGRVVSTDFLYAAGTYVPAKRVTLGVYGGLTNSSDQLDDLFAFGNDFAGAYISYRVWKRTALNLDYAYRKYSFGSLPGAGANIFGISVSYSRAFK